MTARIVDARGKTCPIPIVELSREMKRADAGEEVVVMADDRAFPADVHAWCKKTHHQLVSLTTDDCYFCAVVRKVPS
jgi:TusA-related sulfurtransferase